MTDRYHGEGTPSLTHGVAGQRNGVVVNFFDFKEKQLEAMASDLSLTMGKDGLRRCQVYFSKAKPTRRLPTLYEIDFLDAIVRRRYETPEAVRIGRTNTGHAHLSATREDLIQKLYALCPSLSAPISLSEAAEISSRYLESIGVGHEWASDTASASEKPMLPPPLPSDVAILLLLPSSDAVSCEDAIKALLADRITLSMFMRRGRISSDGIALTLAKETAGAHVNLAMLGSSDPLCLLYEHIGAPWVAIRRNTLALLREAVAKHGLNALFFAVTTKNGMLTLERGEHPELAPDLGLLRELASLGRPQDFQLSVADDPHTPFFESLYDAVMFAMLGCANGVHRTALSPVVRYEFSRSDLSTESCGRNLEAILGIYRAWIELCIADRAAVSFSDAVTAPTWTITQSCRLPNRRVREDSLVFAIPMPVMDDGLPDFAACRTLCDTLVGWSADGKILSCQLAGKQTCAEISAVRALLVESTESLPFPVAPTVSDKDFPKSADEPVANG